MAKERQAEWLEQEFFGDPDVADADRFRTIAIFLWLFLLADGGWWSVADLNRRFPYLNVDMIRNSIWAMANRYGIMRMQKLSPMKFAVDGSCMAPRFTLTRLIYRALKEREQKGALL